MTTHYLGIDYGTKRVGLAYCTNTEGFVFGLPTFNRPKSVKGEDDWEPIFQHLDALWDEKNSFHTVVLGLPKNMDGSEGFMAEEIREFGDAVAESYSVKVVYLDERLSSKLSERELIVLGMKPSRNKGLVDEASAKRILEDYLRSLTV
ncbi:MAG: Holliday junction resolvase RuvX [Vampirovibrionales bacterium]